MKGFKLSLFLFIIWWSIAISSIDENDIPSALEQHQCTTIQENYLNPADVNIINLTSDTVDYSQDFFYTHDLKKICHAQVNEFIWKFPTISGSEEKILTFRTINDTIGHSLSAWYLKSINKIDIVKMDPETYMHQIQFDINIDTQTIFLTALYPTYPEISGFEILQFISNLAFQCEFLIEVYDGSDVSRVYSALYGKRYYEYHFKGVDLSQNFLFKKIVVEKKTFLDSFEEKIKSQLHVKHWGSFESLPQLFHANIQVCENAFVSVESCPITFNTQRIFYEISFQYCIDWSPLGGFPGITLPSSQLFEITSKDMIRIMKKKKQPNMNFVKINWDLDKKILKTYDEIKTQNFDTSFLMKLFSNIFELCFVELEKQKSNLNPKDIFKLSLKQKSNLNPEDIFKLYLRPCVIPNINLFLKYHTDI